MLIYECWQAAGRGELVEDGLQSADPRRRWVAVVCDRAFQISYEGELFFVGKAWRRASAPSPGAVCPLRAFGEPLGFAGCKACGHKVEPATASLRAAEGGTGADPARMARRYGPDMTVPDWHKRLVCSRCGSQTGGVRFDGVPTAVKSAPLLGEHTAEVLADWLGLDAAAVAGLHQNAIV